jgi:hypothetical protein
MFKQGLIAQFKSTKFGAKVYALVTVEDPDEISLSENWPEGVEFYSNLSRYEISGKDQPYPGEPDPNWENAIPMGAYIHSGISFYRGSGKVDQWDSGLAGYLVGHDKDDVEGAAEMMCAYPEYETRVWIQLARDAEKLIRDEYETQDDIVLEGHFTLKSSGSSKLKSIKELEEHIKKEYLDEEEAKTFEWVNTDGI